MPEVSVAAQAMTGGIIMAVLGVLCLIFNRRVGGWFRRFPLFVFGLKRVVAVDEIIYQGFACLLGLLYLGMGMILLAQFLR